MILSPSAHAALIVWEHYQQALLTGSFKTIEHKKIIRDQEQLWREKFLIETEDTAGEVMQAAGCNLIEDSDGLFCIS